MNRNDPAKLYRRDVLAALKTAERFMSGFEGDELQEGIDEKIAQIRRAIVIAERAA